MSVLVPYGKNGGAVLVIEVGLELSGDLGGSRVTLVAPHIPSEATTVTKAGQVIVGGWLSVTITSCGQVVVLSLVTRTAPRSALVPSAKLVRSLLVTVTAPQLSATVGLPMATLVAPHIPGEAKA